MRSKRPPPGMEKPAWFLIGYRCLQIVARENCPRVQHLGMWYPTCALVARRLLFILLTALTSRLAGFLRHQTKNNKPDTRMLYSFGSGPSTMPEYARSINRHPSGNRQYSAHYLPCLVHVPSDFTINSMYIGYLHYRGTPTAAVIILPGRWLPWGRTWWWWACRIETSCRYEPSSRYRTIPGWDSPEKSNGEGRGQRRERSPISSTQKNTWVRSVKKEDGYVPISIDRKSGEKSQPTGRIMGYVFLSYSSTPELPELFLWPRINFLTMS